MGNHHLYKPPIWGIFSVIFSKHPKQSQVDIAESLVKPDRYIKRIDTLIWSKVQEHTCNCWGVPGSE